ncbi:hypothetical protein [Streptomyces ossamyceticus]|uniref:hypothetical protein n=1 Tax=Streptomyces ossamyceticus TaxID=249581 RepID=UPI000AAD1795|nr:hypothetical protein [Streptomyces ossamyceticus]
MTTPLPGPADPEPRPSSPDTEPLLSQRTALVLLIAAFIGTVVGVLALFSAGNVAGALLAGVTGFGTSTVGLHKLIG